MLQLDFNPFPHLETQRLSLRQLLIGDAEQLLSLRSSDEVNRYLDRPKTNSLDEAEKFILRINASVDNNESIYWAIEEKDEGNS